jgi:hypothetical protein
MSAATTFNFSAELLAILARFMGYSEVITFIVSIIRDENQTHVNHLVDLLLCKATPLATQLIPFVPHCPHLSDDRRDQLVVIDFVYRYFTEYMSSPTIDLKVERLIAVDDVHKTLRDVYEEKFTALHKSTHILIHCGSKKKITQTYMEETIQYIGLRHEGETDEEYLNRFVTYIEGLNLWMDLLSTVIPLIIKNYERLSLEVLREWGLPITTTCVGDMEIPRVGRNDDFVTIVQRLSLTRHRSPLVG